MLAARAANGFASFTGGFPRMWIGKSGPVGGWSVHNISPMRTFPLPPDTLRQWRASHPLRADAQDDAFVIYEAPPFAPWRGYLIGPADWNGGGFLPASPGRTIPAALEAWLKS